MATDDAYERTVEEMEEALGMVMPPLGTIPDDDTVTEWPYLRKYTLEETEIPAKYRELMGLAVAANIRCPYCTAFHTEAAKMHGATEDELRETYSLASFTTRYSAMMHAQQYPIEQFKDDLERVTDHLQRETAADD